MVLMLDFCGNTRSCFNLLSTYSLTYMVYTFIKERKNHCPTRDWLCELVKQAGSCLEFDISLLYFDLKGL